MESVIIFLPVALTSYILLSSSSNIPITLSEIEFAVIHHTSVYQNSISHTWESKLKRFINFRNDTGTVGFGWSPSKVNFVFDWCLSWHDQINNNIHRFKTVIEALILFQGRQVSLNKSLKNGARNDTS